MSEPFSDYISFDEESLLDFVCNEDYGIRSPYGAIPIEKCIEPLRIFLETTNQGIQWFSIIPANTPSISNHYHYCVVLVWSCKENPYEETMMIVEPSNQWIIRTIQRLLENEPLLDFRGVSIKKRAYDFTDDSSVDSDDEF
jgi:hypothetical protein